MTRTWLQEAIAFWVSWFLRLADKLVPYGRQWYWQW